MNKSRVRNTLVNTFSGLAMKFVNLFANFAVRTVFIYYLGIEYTGIQAVFTDILTVLSLAELGIGSAITYSLYKPIAEKNYEQMAKLMHLYKVAYRVIATIILVVGLSCLPFLDGIIVNVPNVKEDLTIIYLLYLANVVASYLLIYKSTLFTANQQSYVISGVQVIVTVLRTVAQLIIIVCFRDFLLYLITTISFTVLQNVIISIKADKQFRELRNYKGERLEKYERRTIFKNIKALSIQKISSTVLSGTDSIIISTFLGVGIVGYTSNYTMIISEIGLLSLQFLSSITASLGNLAAVENSEKQYRLFLELNFASGFFFAFCSACLLVTIDEFVGNVWLGEEYILGPGVVVLLCLDFLIKGNITVINSFKDANGLFVQSQYCPLIMVILNIGISIVAVKLIGLPGVYLGTVLSRAVTQMWYYPLVLYKYAFKKKAMGYFVEHLKWILILIICIPLTTYINKFILIPVPIISFIVHALVCVLIFLLLTVLFFAKNENFRSSRAYIADTIKRIKK